jgi:carboxypeptidase Taq
MTTIATAPAAAGARAAYERLVRLVHDARLIASSASLLSWDQETMMPEGGVEYRSRQMAMLAKLSHESFVDPKIGELLAACEGDRSLVAERHSDTAANIREIRRDYDRATKLPSDLVEEMARVASIAQHEWAAARKESDFNRFKPWLKKNIDLLRRKAECLGTRR